MVQAALLRDVLLDRLREHLSVETDEILGPARRRVRGVGVPKTGPQQENGPLLHGIFQPPVDESAASPLNEYKLILVEASSARVVEQRVLGESLGRILIAGLYDLPSHVEHPV